MPSTPIVTMSPPEPETYNKERNITWDEISPSLQALFLSINNDINQQIGTMSSYISTVRFTIGPMAPINPEKEREIWIDTKDETNPILKFYIDRNFGNNPKWEMTKAAWYGGSASDVEFPVVSPTSGVWKAVTAMVWVSAPSSNGEYVDNGYVPKQSMYAAPYDGKYHFRDVTSLFPYNKQLSYTHDGGAVRVVLTNVETGKTLLDNRYDSKSRFFSGLDNNYPEVDVILKKGDRVALTIQVEREPLSTDDVDIYMSTSIKVLRANSEDAEYVSDANNDSRADDQYYNSHSANDPKIDTSCHSNCHSKGTNPNNTSYSGSSSRGSSGSSPNRVSSGNSNCHTNCHCHSRTVGGRNTNYSRCYSGNIEATRPNTNGSNTNSGNTNTNNNSGSSACHTNCHCHGWGGKGNTSNYSTSSTTNYSNTSTSSSSGSSTNRSNSNTTCHQNCHLMHW